MSGVALVVEVALALGVVAFVGYPLLRSGGPKTNPRRCLRNSRTCTAARSRRTRRSRSSSSTTRRASSRTPTTTNSIPVSAPRRSRSSRPSTRRRTPLSSPSGLRSVPSRPRRAGRGCECGVRRRCPAAVAAARQEGPRSGQDGGGRAVDLSGMRPREPGRREVLRRVRQRAGHGRLRARERRRRRQGRRRVCGVRRGLETGTALLRRMWGGGPSLSLTASRHHRRDPSGGRARHRGPGTVEVLRALRCAARGRLRAGPGPFPDRLRTQRRRQDDPDQGAEHADQAQRGVGQGGRPRRRPSGRRAAAPHRGHLAQHVPVLEL